MKFKKTALFTLSIIISLVLLELGLRFVLPLAVNLSYTNKIYDEKLGHIANKSLRGIDENGFRNPKILDQAEFVVLGDSHTYGVNASLEESWPQQLAEMTNMSVYNFGLGGYGSLQYYYLMKQAIKLRPKYIIIGLYLANDLNDVCKLINERPYWQVRLKELGYSVRNCITSSNVSITLKNTLSKLHLSLLTTRSFKKIYERLNLGDFITIREGGFSIIIKNKRITSHRRNMDMEREHIRLGFEITKDIIEDSNQKALLNDTELIVVFITSKERAFFDYLTERGYQLPADYRELVENEVKLIEMFLDSFKEQGIRFVDTKPYVQEQIYKSKPVYQSSDDGHPLGIGYNAYARAIFDCIIKENIDEEYCNKGPSVRERFADED